MGYNLMPSLQHRVLVSIATRFWNEEDIKVLTESHLSEVNNENGTLESWYEIIEKVLEKVSNLPLEELLKKAISGTIYAIGWQILAWMVFHNRSSGFFMDNLPDEFSWTSRGNIDIKKTVEQLVRGERYNIVTRYKLACTYCLEADVYRLWQELGAEEFHGKDLTRIMEEESELFLVVFWSYCVEGKIEELKDQLKSYCFRSDSAYEYALRLALESGNEAATRYFLHKLTTEEKDNIVVEAAANVALLGADFFDPVAKGDTVTPLSRHGDTLCFLLSTMSSQQQERVFELCPRHVLQCLLEWPWQDLFVQTAKRMWAWLPLRDCNLLLHKIVSKAAASRYPDYDYKKLFEAFWLESPLHYREHVAHVCTCDGKLLSKLLESGDEINIVRVLDALTEEEKEAFIFDKGITHCKSLMDENQWDLLEFFIQECLLSKRSIVKFKELFERDFLPSRDIEELNFKKKIIRCLNNLIQEKQ